MNVVFSSSLTRSPIGQRLVKLISTSKYVGPFNELSGKFPNLPGAGTANNPGRTVELLYLPPSGAQPVAPFVVVLMHNKAGSMKKIPDGVLNTPTCFLKSSKLIPTRSTGLLPALKLLNVVRFDATNHGGRPCHVTIAPTFQLPMIWFTTLFVSLNQFFPLPKGSS